ncbi:hypothetical protein NDU88_001028 [Pleurodeles waltl]|uniref:Uncharacterized protein n=1 Tax=Pleurodeles waltl TaxID=8319 RepID=A0AAV7TH65_PLEWA|nr:hypothetical protein NDU88_001028 [Pleurodeles waltl]
MAPHDDLSRSLLGATMASPALAHLQLPVLQSLPASYWDVAVDASISKALGEQPRGRALAWAFRLKPILTALHCQCKSPVSQSPGTERAGVLTCIRTTCLGARIRPAEKKNGNAPPDFKMAGTLHLKKLALRLAGWGWAPARQRGPYY